MGKIGDKIRLRTLMLVLTAILIIIPAAVTGLVYTDRMRGSVENILLTRLADRGQLSGDQLARRFYRLWLEVANTAKTISLEASEALQVKLNTIRQVDTRYSWIGVADIQGRLVAETGASINSQDVAKQEWFRYGLQGSFGGEYVDAAANRAQTGNESTGEYRIGFAAPILGPNGQVVGVMGAYFDWAWVRDVLESFRTPEIDVVLLARDRRVLFGPAGMELQPLELGSAVAASQGVAAPRVERWPDGQDYLTYILPRIEHRNLPSFGWSLIVRQNASSAFSSVNHLFRSFWSTFGIGALVALASLFALISWLTHSIGKLTEYAAALSEGKDLGPPPEVHTSCEAAELSNALARLQSRLKSGSLKLTVVEPASGSG